MSFNPLLFANLPYNADTDFVPVGRLFFLVEGLFASSAINVNKVAELKTLAQGKPEGLNYATLGEGSYPDLFLKWMNNQWGTKLSGSPTVKGAPRPRHWRLTTCRLRASGLVISSGLWKPAR